MASMTTEGGNMSPLSTHESLHVSRESSQDQVGSLPFQEATTAIQFSNHESHLVERLRPEVGAKNRGSSDVTLPTNRPLHRQQKAALVKFSDTEKLLMETNSSTPLSPTDPPLENKGMPQKRKLSIKKARWPVDDTMKEREKRGSHVDLGKPTPVDEGRFLPVEIVPKLISMEEARRLAMIFDLGSPGLSHTKLNVSAARSTGAGVLDIQLG